ncbi:MAG: tRNA adenosine(34) deaminase TadA [Candidatus Marinimicrobia bacterium]|nr:tRNA adenosine(34) deaminase TadA [Candidatus Neomarinimicrobiota bacterium]MDP6726273.1 tRNA adenosine(34) deaminase TadA [Candidatus Neomarinimicrobiota bacterium]
MVNQQEHQRWMAQALLQAHKAFENNEVPIGAIIVKDHQVVGRGYNQKEKLKDPTAHAEILAITAAANTLEDWRLTDCVLYVTKEPCPMCAGAIVMSRLKMVVFGCYDEDKGCCGSLYQLCGDPRLGQKIAVKGGILDNESLELIQDFFRTKRKA